MNWSKGLIELAKIYKNAQVTTELLTKNADATIKITAKAIKNTCGIYSWEWQK